MIVQSKKLEERVHHKLRLHVRELVRPSINVVSIILIRRSNCGCVTVEALSSHTHIVGGSRMLPKIEQISHLSRQGRVYVSNFSPGYEGAGLGGLAKISHIDWGGDSGK